MILLTERMDRDTKALAFSLKQAGYSCPLISIYEDGFLPEGFISPYGSYLYGDQTYEEKPVYFDEIKIPKFWEIKGTGSNTEVFELHHKRAKAYYAEPKIKRYVRVVDWFDEDGRVRLSDHYNRYGHRFAQTVLDEEKKPLIKTYFTPDGKEKIVENLQVGTVILMEEDGMKFFKDKQDFVIHFLKEKGYAQDRIFFNSLGLPFQISLRLGREGILADDILFWQEDIKDAVPGNMQMIFRGEAARIKKVAVQKKNALEKLKKLAPSREGVYSGLGFIYDFKKENGGTPNILIFTNSDQIEHLQELVENLPMYMFRIAAVTEMSSKLLSMASYKNVRVYPNIPPKKVEPMMMEADYYLDINRGGEILNATEEAFLHNLVMIGFEETVHNRNCIAPENMCKAEEFQVLINTLKLMLEDPGYKEELLSLQWEHGMREEAENYCRLIEN